MSVDDPVVIVGGGVAGLTLAWCLSKAGRPVTVLERDCAVGGLAKSYRYGDYVFDVGPHRFYTEEPEVTAFIAEILGDDTLLIPRSSAVFMSGRFIEWPLTISALSSITPGLLLNVFLDMFRSKKSGVSTFEEYITGRYGQTLYEIFFKPYTEKFLGISCSDTAREWAIAGIDRATIDSKIGVQSLISLAGSLLRHREPLQFIYPGSAGIGVFVDNLVAGIRASGGDLHLDSGVEGVTVINGEITSVSTKNSEYPCSRIVWTAPLNALAGCLKVARPAVEYLSLVLYNYRLKTPCAVPYQWCYFGEAQIPFNRVSFPTRFNPKLAPTGCSGICVEVTCRTTDPLWSNPMDREPAIRKVLAGYGMILSDDSVEGVAIERVNDAYPVYRTGALDEVRRFTNEIPVSNLTLSGRTGGFWYNNMDNSISEALRLAVDLDQKGMHHE